MRPVVRTVCRAVTSAMVVAGALVGTQAGVDAQEGAESQLPANAIAYVERFNMQQTTFCGRIFDHRVVVESLDSGEKKTIMTTKNACGGSPSAPSLNADGTLVVFNRSGVANAIVHDVETGAFVEAAPNCERATWSPVEPSTLFCLTLRTNAPKVAQLYEVGSGATTALLAPDVERTSNPKVAWLSASEVLAYGGVVDQTCELGRRTALYLIDIESGLTSEIWNRCGDASSPRKLSTVGRTVYMVDGYTSGLVIGQLDLDTGTVITDSLDLSGSEYDRAIEATPDLTGAGYFVNTYRSTGVATASTEYQIEWIRLDGLRTVVSAMSEVSDSVFYVSQANPPDADKDGVRDDIDNCLGEPNLGQADLDGDGIGDACSDEVDTVAPLVAGTLVDSLNGNGWLNTLSVIVWTASDPDPSDGFAAPTIPDTEVTEEGAVSYESDEVCDLSGNCATGLMEVSLDLTPPIVTVYGVNDFQPNLQDVTCEASDEVSGLDGSCVLDLVEVNFAVYSGTASATDLAGNTTVVDVHFETSDFDSEPPTIFVNESTEGWFAEPPTFTFTCDDAGSGVVECPGPLTVSTEGQGQEFYFEIDDVAGNGESVSLTIDVDLSDPTILASLDPAPNEAGWNSTPVTVSFVCDDVISGVESCFLPVEVNVDGVSEVGGSAVDAAGRLGETSIPVSLDQIAPVVSMVGFVDGDVLAVAPVVACEALDLTSGLDGECQVSSVDLGAGVVAVTASASDVAGNFVSVTSSYALVLNAAPVAVDDSVSVLLEDGAVTVAVLDNDSDVDGNLDPDSIAIIAGASLGSVAVVVDAEGTRVEYIPTLVGTDSFSYEVCDLLGECDSALVTVTVMNESACTIVGTPGADTLRGTNGDDVICGRGGDDTILGRGGNDLIFGGAGADVIRAGPGDDEVRGGRGADEIYGNAGDDVLRGGRGADVIRGGDGADEVRGGRGADELFGNAGDDVLRGGLGRDVLHGNAGADALFGGAGADALFGNGGNDVLRGHRGADVLFGNAGDDVLRGGRGIDDGDGGSGVDACFGVETTNRC